jgi:hypothetical protein
LLFMAVVSGCASPEVTSPTSPPPGGTSPPGARPNPTPGAPSNPAGGGGTFTLPDAGSGPAAVPPDKDKKCAEDIAEAKQTPVDLLLLMDSSGSMDNPLPRTKWLMVRDALGAFIKDTKSGGMGVGLQFFPIVKEKSCMGDNECGGFGSRPIFLCVKKAVCADKGVTPATGKACTPTRAVCAKNVACANVGRCSVSGAECIMGQPCPGAPQGETCNDMPGTCRDLQTSCTGAEYEKPAVEIGELPLAQPNLTKVLEDRVPGGSTPMEAAVQGALAHLAAHAAAHPGRRPVLVLATDGAPEGCMTNDAMAIANRLEAARTGPSAISTYVIGVFTQNELMATQKVFQSFSMAGGTGSPFLLLPNEDLAQKFLQTLQEIRGSALACEFEIPPPKMGTLDYKKVNMSFQGAGGTEEILYAGTADRCDPVKGGWYYDANPDSGGKPTRVIACPATCKRFKSEPTGRVELRFGCGTNYIP